MAELPGAAFIHLYVVSRSVTAASHVLAEDDVLHAENHY